MAKTGQLLLITGPAGSGKTTLARYAATQPGWVSVSEDDYWVKHDWGSGLRSSEQEKVVQQEVITDVTALAEKGNKVALEFILYYPAPPNPLTNYQAEFSKLGIKVRTVALKPSLEEITRRLVRRGRQNDIDNLDAKRQDARHQIACLESEYIKKEWLVDPTNRSVEDLFAAIEAGNT